jgi:hypothetical protein
MGRHQWRPLWSIVWLPALAEIKPSRDANARVFLFAVARLKALGCAADHPVSKSNLNAGFGLWSTLVEGYPTMDGQMFAAMLKNEIENDRPTMI